MAVLITGVAGFIGFHAARALLARGETVFGLDDLNPYYGVALKRARLAELEAQGGAFRFEAVDIADMDALREAVSSRSFRKILHLAAQPGVRYSLEAPHAYGRANLVGHLNMLELARHADGLEAMVYASSSSVYGASETPAAETLRADAPVSLYAATKRSGELMSEAYAHLFGLALTGLRFFTVYGSWGRPDMAVWSFTERILSGEPIAVYDGGRLRRDFTYVDDIVAGVLAVLDRPPPGHRLYNLGNNRPVEVLRLVGLIEQASNRRAIIEDRPRPPGDVTETCADITRIRDEYGWSPTTPLEEGVPRFVDWYARDWLERRDAAPP